MELPGISSAADLMALAIAAECRARERYARLGDEAACRGWPDLSHLLWALAREEEAHAMELRRLCSERGWGERAARPPESPPWGEAAEDLDAALAGGRSLYDCLARAVRGEEKAFSFYSYLAAQSPEQEIRELAETLAQEELEHAHRLRSLRRQAYHRERALPKAWPKAQGIAGLEDLRAAARHGEARFLALLQGAGLTEAQKSGAEEATRALAAELGVELASEPLQGPASDRDVVLEAAEAAFAFYDAVALGARREEVMLAAQLASQLALNRIKVLVA